MLYYLCIQYKIMFTFLINKVNVGIEVKTTACYRVIYYCLSNDKM